jgi:hypothetical protein
MDTLQLDSPAGQAELKVLEAVTVGTIRKGGLFPALDVGVEWVCTAVGQGYWEFDGLFFGQPLCKAMIQHHQQAGMLVLDVRGLA